MVRKGWKKHFNPYRELQGACRFRLLVWEKKESQRGLEEEEGCEEACACVMRSKEMQRHCILLLTLQQHFPSAPHPLRSAWETEGSPASAHQKQRRKMKQRQPSTYPYSVTHREHFNTGTSAIQTDKWGDDTSEQPPPWLCCARQTPVQWETPSGL